MTTSTIKPTTRLSVSDWQKVATENVVARRMARAKFKLNDLGTRGGVGLRAVYLCGPPGVGKTKSIVDQEAIWRSHGMEPLRFRPTNVTELLDYFEQAGGVRPLIMEEADVIFRSKPMFEVLKKATDSETPDVEYRMKRIDGEKVAMPIRLDVPIVVSTNIDLLGEAGWDPKLVGDRDALFDRSKPISIPSEPYALWEWSIYLALTSHLTARFPVRNPSGGLPMAQSNPLFVQAAAMDWFTDNVQRISVISPRTLKTVAQLFGRAHRHDLPISILEDELDGLTGYNVRHDIATPTKADWSALLKAMPKQRVAAPVLQVAA
jgi:hypothetical protein